MTHQSLQFMVEKLKTIKLDLSQIARQGVYQFPGVAITKDHKPGGLNDRNLLSHSPGGQKY